MTRKLLIFLLIFVAIWDPVLPAFITIPGLGSLTPIRVFVILAFVYNLLTGDYIKASDMKKKTIVCFGVIFFYGLIIFLWVLDIATALSTSIIYLTSFLSVICSCFLIKSHDDLIYVSKIILVNSVVLAVMGIYESITGTYLFFQTSKLIYMRAINPVGLRYPLTIFFNINNMSTFLVLSLPFGFIGFENFRLKKLLRYIYLAVITVCLFLLDSRISLFSIALFIILYVFESKSIMKKFCYLSGFVFLMVLLQSYIEKTRIFSFLSGFSFDSLLGEGRWTIWSYSLSNASRNIFMGRGFGQSTVLNSIYPSMYTTITIPHNWFIELIMDFGIVGLASFLLWFSTLYKKIRSHKKKYNRNSVLSFLHYFLIIFVLMSICPSSIKQSYYVFIYLGICVSMADLYKVKANTSQPPRN